MTRLIRTAAALAAILFLASTTTAFAATLAPLATFGGGDGWRAPFEVLTGDAAGTDTGGLYNYLGNAVDSTSVNSGNLERGLAYNPTTGNLILVSRSPAGAGIGLRILDGATGDDLGGLNPGSGVISSDGQFPVNMVGITDDGVIYVDNLSINNTQPFKAYRWESESSAAPTVAYSGLGPTSPLNGARIGDTFDVIGSGADTRLVGGYYHMPVVAGNNSFALFDTEDGSAFTASHVTIDSNPPAAGDFRLGITFTDNDTIIGKQGTDASPLGRVVDVVGSTGTLAMNLESDGASLRPMDFAVVDGRPLLVMLEASPSQEEIARARIFVYDMTDPTASVAERKIAEGSNLPFFPGGPNQFQNINATGSVKFGAINGNVVTIYAMSTNNGIQAFELTLDPLPMGNDGDYNGNGVVDAADYTVWRDTLGLDVEPGTGADGDGDSVIGPGDYDHWVARFGNVVGEGAAAGNGAGVPEPGTLGLACLAMLACTGVRRCTRHRSR